MTMTARYAPGYRVVNRLLVEKSEAVLGVRYRVAFTISRCRGSAEVLEEAGLQAKVSSQSHSG